MNVTELGAGKRLPQFSDGSHSIGSGQRADFSPQPESYPQPPAIPYGSINIALNAMKRAMNGEATKNADIKTNGQSIMLTKESKRHREGQQRHFVMLGTRDGRPIVRYSLVLGDGNGGSTTNFRTADIADLPLNATREELDRFVRALPIDRRQNYPDTLETAQRFTRELLNVGRTLYEENLNHRPTSLANAAHSAAGFVDMTTIEALREDARLALYKLRHGVIPHALDTVRAAAQRLKNQPTATNILQEPPHPRPSNTPLQNLHGRAQPADRHHLDGHDVIGGSKRAWQSSRQTVQRTDTPIPTPHQPERHTNPTETVLSLFQGLQLKNTESPALDNQGIISLVPDVNDPNQTSRWVYTDGSTIRMMARQQNGTIYVVSISRGENNRITTKVRTYTPEDRRNMGENLFNSVHTILSRNDTTNALIAPEGSENTVLQGLYRLLAADLSTSRNNVNSSRKITLERFMSTIQTLNPFIAEQARQQISQAPIPQINEEREADTSPIPTVPAPRRNEYKVNIERTGLSLLSNIELSKGEIQTVKINNHNVTIIPTNTDIVLFHIDGRAGGSGFGVAYPPTRNSPARVVYLSNNREEVGTLAVRMLDNEETEAIGSCFSQDSAINSKALAGTLFNISTQEAQYFYHRANGEDIRVANMIASHLDSLISTSPVKRQRDRALTATSDTIRRWTLNSELQNYALSFLEYIGDNTRISPVGEDLTTFRFTEKDNPSTIAFIQINTDLIHFSFPEGVNLRIDLQKNRCIFSLPDQTISLHFSHIDPAFGDYINNILRKIPRQSPANHNGAVAESVNIQLLIRKLRMSMDKVANSENHFPNAA